MVIVATPSVATFDSYVVLVATNVVPTIESLPTYRRYYAFDLIISEQFSSTNNAISLALSDEASPYTDKYPLVDRLNKYITGQELIGYAGKRRCIRCVYDNVYKVVRVNSCICPITLTIPTPSPSPSPDTNESAPTT